jgi:hypothetical protein
VLDLSRINGFGRVGSDCLIRVAPKPLIVSNESHPWYCQLARGGKALLLLTGSDTRIVRGPGKAVYWDRQRNKWHTYPVLDVTMCRLSPDGDRVALKTPTHDGQGREQMAVVVADPRTGRKLLDLEDQPVGRPFWSVDGSRLAVVLADEVVIYDALTGKQLCTCKGLVPTSPRADPDLITPELHWSPDGERLSAAVNGSLVAGDVLTFTAWDARTGRKKCDRVFKGRLCWRPDIPAQVREEATWSPDGHYVLSWQGILREPPGLMVPLGGKMHVWDVSAD